MDIETQKRSLVRLHRKNRERIRRRLEELSETLDATDERIFSELTFCLCTPQTKAKNAWNKAICPLMESGRLYSIDEADLARHLRDSGVRFHNTKAARIMKARREILKGLGEQVRGKDALRLRCCLRDQVSGLGLKEASHFLRNIGLGSELAILDRHILRNLALLGVIDNVPKNLGDKKYLEIEERMRKFSRETGIPMDELDLLLWMKETGEVFK